MAASLRSAGGAQMEKDLSARLLLIVLDSA